MIDLRLLIPAAVSWAVCLGVVLVPASLPAVAVTCGVVTAAASVGGVVLRRLAGRWAGILAVCGAAAGLVVVAVLVQQPVRSPAVLTNLRSVDGARVRAEQTIVPSARYFAATLTRVRGASVAVPVLVFGAAPDARVALGSTLEISGSLQATGPGDRYAELVFAHAPGRVVGAPPGYLAWAGSLRARLAGDVEGLPGDGAALVPGLALGDTSAASPGLLAAMKSASLTHLTAVSGENCTVLVALVLLACRAAGLPRGLRAVLSLGALAGFVVLVTPQPSVLRAAVMAAITVIALARGRPTDGLPLIGAAILVLLVVDPWLAADYGFALSVLATLGLLLLGPPIASRLERWMPRWIALALSVPVAAQLACQPVLLMLQPSLPLYGVVANALAEPAAPAATVFGLGACLLLPGVPWLGHALDVLAWLPASWIAAVARFFAALPAAAIPWPSAPLGPVLLGIVLAAGAVVVVIAIRRRLRVALAMCLVLTVGCGIAAGIAGGSG